MAAPDMEVIKDIPGYKVILKAVLKSQIQTLVEQLASTTDEESVILTASVVDGTLSHLGSSSGKVFLEDHEDIKSQFLGFCLKHHHKQKQEKERREAQEREEAMQRSMQAMRQQHSARFSSPGRQGYPHPMGMVRAAGPARMRTPPLRHQPYPMSRPQRPARSPGHAQPSTPSKLDGQIIKIEPDDNSNQSESDNVQTQDPSGTGSGSTETSQPSSPVVKPATPSHGPGASDNDDAESSNSTIPLNDGSDLKLSDTNPPGGLSLDSDLSNIIAASTSGDTNNEQQQQGVNYDPNISVKLENVGGDPEMDLEITGVELGQRPVPEPSGSQEWMANVQDYMQGATGSVADMSSNQQGYNMIDLSHSCDSCDQFFTSGAELQEHAKIHTDEKPVICSKCGKILDDIYVSTDVQFDALTEESGLISKGFQCGSCASESFIDKNEEPCVVLDTSNGCSFDGKLEQYTEMESTDESTFDGNLKPYAEMETMNENSGNKDLKPFSEMGTTNEFPLGVDMKAGLATEANSFAGVLESMTSCDTDSCDGSKPLFKCDKCGKPFKRKFFYTRHVAKHRVVNSLKCEKPLKCEKSVKCENHLKLEKPFKCEICGKQFKLKEHLSRHLVMHSGMRPFKCHLCGKCFTHKGNLTTHLASIHSGIRPFGCDFCGKKFAQKGNLETHVMTLHAKIKPHKCNFCGKTFAQKGNLETHVMTMHAKIKPHKCDFCGKKFAQKGNLATHMLMHTGAKPFECGVCGKAFAYKSNLVTHLSKHTGAKPFKCTKCDREFSLKGNMIKHVKLCCK